jgi:hypothetical protein
VLVVCAVGVWRHIQDLWCVCALQRNLPDCYLKTQKLRYTELSISLPVVLYGYETWSLTLREKRRLRVFDNGVLRGIFGRKRDEVTE